MRQTNVLWVGMCAGNFLIDTLVLKYGKRVKIKSRLKQTNQAPIDYTFEVKIKFSQWEPLCFLRRSPCSGKPPELLCPFLTYFGQFIIQYLFLQ